MGYTGGAGRRGVAVGVITVKAEGVRESGEEDGVAVMVLKYSAWRRGRVESRFEVCELSVVGLVCKGFVKESLGSGCGEGVHEYGP